MTEEIKNKGRDRLKEEKQKLCDQWKVSGKSKTQFCKEIGLPLGTFAHWCKQVYPPLKKNSDILPVKIINKHPVSQEDTEKTKIIVSMGNTTISFKLTIKNLVPFIQELSHAVTTIR